MSQYLLSLKDILWLVLVAPTSIYILVSIDEFADMKYIESCIKGRINDSNQFDLKKHNS